MWRARYFGLSALTEFEMVRYDVLTQRVVGVQADVVWFRIPYHGLLTRWQLAKFRHPKLHDEAAAGRQMTGGVAETCDLLGLRQQVEMVLKTR